MRSLNVRHQRLGTWPLLVPFTGSDALARPDRSAMSQVIGVPRETFAGEKRVATVPEVVEKLIKLGFRVVVETGAGEAANFSDETYRSAGAEIVPDVWSMSDIIFKVRAPEPAEVAKTHE